MSKIERRRITCPKCGKQGEQIVWASINVDLDPEAKKRIFNEDIFSWECPHCGLKVVAPFSTLYHNMEKKVMIYYFPRRSDDGTGLSSSKGHFPLQDDYIYRSVYNLYDFKEKIGILEAGLDDGAIELIKHMFLHDSRPENLSQDVQYRFIGVGPGSESISSKKSILLQCIEPGKGIIGVLPLPYDMYEGIVADRISERIFPLDADFPEVSQYVLKEMKKH